jgi:Trk-type K+ transport system membrane component
MITSFYKVFLIKILFVIFYLSFLYFSEKPKLTVEKLIFKIVSILGEVGLSLIASRIRES